MLKSEMRVNIAPHIRLLTADRSWELDQDLPTDSICPEVISRMTTSALDDILDQSMQRMVALDWSTIRMQMVDRPGNTTLMIFQVDVL